MANSIHLDRDLTILSVNAQDKRFLDLNYELTTSLNGADEFVWLVVDNAQEMIEEWMDRDDDRFFVIDGVRFEAKDHLGSRSYHHARGLNLGLQHVETRFVLFLDPDCFIVRERWIRDVLEHMKLAELSFFGVPCHPKKHTAYRYFPYVACLFVDLDRVDRRDLDFTPEIDEQIIMKRLRVWVLLEWLVSGARPREVEEPIEVDRAYILDVLRRRAINKFLVGTLHIGNAWIGSSGDTGSRIYRRFINDPTRNHDHAVPVWRVQRTSPRTSIKQKVMGKIKQNLVPDALSVIPKRRDYFINATFSDLGAYDVENAFRCESYLWRGAPFCFHIRSIGLKNEPTDVLREAIHSFLGELVSEY